MTVTLNPELAKRLEEEARQRNTTLEQLVRKALEEKFPDPDFWEPRDEWERRVINMGKPAGVSPSDEALRRENLYD